MRILKSTHALFKSGRRLSFVSILLWASLSFSSLAASPPGRFTYATLKAEAQKLASNEYRPVATPNLPEPFAKLSYDDYQSIHFVPAQGPWQNDQLRFTFQFFHRGFIYREPVTIHLVEQGQVHDFSFAPSQFNYGKLKVPADLPANLQFAGLRVLYPLNSSNKQDEVAAFLGASYFRVVGAHQRYGVSARGVAIDTAEPTGEQFPRFTQFWIEKPGPLDNTVRLYALLDGPSAAGAFRFDIRPGEVTQIEVEASVFFRKAVKKLGIAPATSMFLSGENRTWFVPDFRPEIHDSDGLLIQPDSGEMTWRPLVNPEKEHAVSRFPAGKLKGFGLLQRDREFDHYQDLAGRYELRPSLWIEPQDNWGTGTVELVEIPTPTEYNDNIVAYWVPAQQPERGQERHWIYRLSACADVPEKTGLLYVHSTRITPQHDKTPPRFVIDFMPKGAEAPAAGTAIETKIETTHGSIRNVVTEKNEVTGGWRTFFDLVDAGRKPVELRAVLHEGSQILSETWVYPYQQP